MGMRTAGPEANVTPHWQPLLTTAVDFTGTDAPLPTRPQSQPFAGPVSYFKRFKMQIDLHHLCGPVPPQGFGQVGLARARLEVTAQNDRAVRLYRSLGFRRCKTVYKAVSTPLC